jgi:2-oxoglutarate ferredoxin oxidoreductase subunit beta
LWRFTRTATSSYDGAYYKPISDKEVRADNMLYLEHGKPMMIFGKDRNKGIRLNGIRPEVVTIGEHGVTVDDLLVHDENAEDPTLAYLLTQMNYPEFPVPMGVFRSVSRPTFEELTQQQIEMAMARGKGNLERLLHSGDTWVVE